MSGPTTLRDILGGFLRDRAASWSIGGYGAVAEFHWRPGDPCDAGTDLTAATEAGALRLCLRDDVVPYAYQRLSRFPDRWLHGITLCLPWRRARRGARHALTELGPDREAVRRGDRGDVLFDLGLGLPHVDACVRTRCPGLLKALRAACGHSVLAPDNGAMAAIKAADPHRVFVSNLGRLEVYQRIGRADMRPPTPEGPHTHVLPRLLGAPRPRGQPREAPAGHRACAHLYPEHPLVDGRGRSKPYDRAAHAAFRAHLDRWGDPAFLAEKRRAAAALGAGVAADRYPPPGDIRGRHALRIAIREHARAEGESDVVAGWRRRFDRVRAPRDAHGAH